MTIEAGRNVKLVEQVYAAFARRDLPIVLSLFSPNIEISQSNELPWGGSYGGHAGASQFFSKLTQAINSAVSIERIIDAGDNIVVIGWTHGNVNQTGERYDVPIAHVWTIADDQVTRAQFYIDNPRMLAALQGRGSA
jgi:ketosteroid isomerase-like protein